MIIKGIAQKNQSNKIISPLLDHQLNQIKRTDHKSSEVSVKTSNKSSKINLKFTFQVYLASPEDENDIYQFSLLQKSLKSSKGYVKHENINDCYVAEHIFDQPYQAFNCLFEIPKQQISRKFDANDIIVETIKYLIRNNKKQTALHWFNAKPKSLSLPNAHFFVEGIEFGNLVTPFEFCSLNNNVSPNLSTRIKCESKIIINFNLKTIFLISIIDTTFFKFEIQFECIDRLICIDEKDDFINIFLPLNRTPFIYKLK